MNYLHQMNILRIYWRAGWARNTALAIVAVFTLGLASCAQQTAPTTEASETNAMQADNSRDAADLTATAVGTESGGAGMVFNDAFTLANGGQIQGAVVTKGANVQSDDTIHTATVTRTKNKNGFGYQGTWTHTWIFRDANGVAMPHFIKGQTNEIDISTVANHSVTTPRVGTQDSSSGSWVISNLIAGPAMVNGSLSRAGLTTRTVSGQTRSHSFTINWTNDTLVRGLDKDLDDTVVYLLGNANSDLKAVGFKGNTFERQVQIVFHGDGTATLTVTRTSGNGKVDTFTIDVKRGIWLRDDHIG